MEPLPHNGAESVDLDGRSGDPFDRDDGRETLSALRASLPAELPAPTPRSTVLERRARRETPKSAVLLTAPHRDRATLTVLSGVDPGCVFALQDDATVLGRSRGATLSIDEPSISRHHARVVRTEDGRHVLEDLGSRNGTFVNGCAVRRVALRSGDRVQLGPDLIFRFALVDEREETLQRRLYESSTRDSLTGLTNRRCLLERLELAIERGRTDGNDTGMLMIDVDHFKRINDTFGHLVGDEVLRALATSAGSMLRAADLFARYGGEEFVAVICCEVKDDLVALAERVRLSFADVRVEVGSSTVSATVSVGVALWSECRSANYLDLIALADDRMYSAKLGGRNGVCSTAPAIRVLPSRGHVGTR